MKIIVLGNGSASPSIERAPSAMVLEYKNKYILFDCGEGTQYKFLKYKLNFNKLTHILITHLHGDHYSGLFGMISTMNSWGREKELTIIAPHGLKEILSLQFKYQNSSIAFDVNFIASRTESFEYITENKDIVISSFPLSHRVPTTGFLIKEKPKDYSLIKEKLPKNISIAHIHLLKTGNNVFDDGGKLLYNFLDFTTSPQKPKSFAYCSDTIFDENIVNHCQDADLIYHEATFLDEHLPRASSTFHSTASQAAIIAKQANAKKLLIGHFSARYNSIEPFLFESTKIFANTTLAIEGLEVEI